MTDTNANPQYDVVAVGNALVDILAPVTEAELQAICLDQGAVKGSMSLIDADRAAELLQALNAPTYASGGSAANTMAGLASFGGRGGFIGKISDDDLGRHFAADMQAQNIDFHDNPAQSGLPTGCCTILVTPDGERTMNTFLGISTEITPADLSADMITTAQVIYLEGYLFDKDQAKETFIEAAKIAKSAGTKIAMTLSDPFCVDRHREDFLTFISEHVDILFANEEEIKGLFETNDFDIAAQLIKDKAPIAALTRSEKGALILTREAEYTISARPVEKVIDTTGAGDQFAAGFLYGYTHGKTLDICGDLGALAAAEVISHIGPRPQILLRDLAPKAA